MKSKTKGGEQVPVSTGLSLKMTMFIYAALIIYLCGYIAYKTNNNQIPEVYPDNQVVLEEIKSEKIEKSETQEDKIVKLIIKTFPENPKLMLAIALEESGLNPNAVGYNCRYKIGGKTYDRLTHTYIDLNTITINRKTGYVSTFCRPGDEKYAWSRDGSIFQVNNATDYEISITGNIKKAREIYDNQGLSAWVSYTSGNYKKHLARADALITKNTN